MAHFACGALFALLFPTGLGGVGEFAVSIGDASAVTSVVVRARRGFFC